MQSRIILIRLVNKKWIVSTAVCTRNFKECVSGKKKVLSLLKNKSLKLNNCL